MTRKTPVGILISGRGRNLEALIAAARQPDYPAEIRLVISNVPNAPGLQIAEDAGINTRTFDHREFPNRELFDDMISGAMTKLGVALICNAGFMRLHSAAFVSEWRGRQLNIHPSLLPAFRGLHPQRQALKAGVRISGATVHFVSEEMDAGPIIAQGAVPVLLRDTEEILSERILKTELKLYPLALALVASGQARLEAGRVVFDSSDDNVFLAADR